MGNQLDEIDVKILKELLTDARKSFQHIARECNVTKNAIWKHFKKLQRAGLITGSTIQINYKELAFEAVATIALSVSSKDTAQVIEQIKKMPDFHIIHKMFSKYNIGIIANLKNVEELDKVHRRIKNLAGVLDTKTNIWMNVLNTPENLSLMPGQEIGINEYPAAPYLFPQKIDYLLEEIGLSSELDETNVKILRALSKDSRAPFRRIAQEIGVAPYTVKRRYEKLQKNGIVRSVIQLDPTKIGYVGAIIITVNLEENVDLLEIAQKLSKIPSVVLILTVYGENELEVLGLSRDVNQQLSILERIEQVPNLRIASTTIHRVRNIWPHRLEITSTVSRPKLPKTSTV